MFARSSFDFDAQRIETAEVYADLSTRVTIPPTIRLDLQFTEGLRADYDGLTTTASNAGYSVSAQPKDGKIELSIEVEDPSASVISKHESRTTELALARGFLPHGWGLRASSGGFAGWVHRTFGLGG